MRSDCPRRIVIDSGPLYGVMFEGDDHHADAARGFRQLYAGHTDVTVPVPILFAVYKRLSYDVGPDRARRALDFITASLTILYLGSDDVERLQALVTDMPWWGGSLEDALLAMIGLARDLPVWTYNYRDLQAFPNLQFWTPAPA